MSRISEIWTLITLIRLIRHTYFNMFNMKLSSIIQSLFWLNKCNTQKEKLCDTAEICPFDLLLCLLSEIHLKSNSIEVMYSIVGFQIYSKIMHFSVRRFAPIHIHHWAAGYPPPKCPPLGGDLMWSHRCAQKNSIFSTYLNMLHILITWNY